MNQSSRAPVEETSPGGHLRGEPARRTIVSTSASAATTAGTDVLAGADALSEVSIDVNPTDPDNLVVAGHEPGTFENMNTFFTTDGGDTWTEVNLGDGQDGLGSNFRFDPAVVFDSAGNVFVAYGAKIAGATTTTTLVVARSTDGGATYTNFAQLSDVADPSPPDGGLPGNDKWMMAAGSCTGQRQRPDASTSPGRRTSAKGMPAATSTSAWWPASTDDGVNWSAPVIINDSSERGHSGQPTQRGPGRGPGRDAIRHLARRTKQSRAPRPVDQQRRRLGYGHLVHRHNRGVQDLDPPKPDRGIFAGPVIDVDSSRLNTGRMYFVYVDMGAARRRTPTSTSTGRTTTGPRGRTASLSTTTVER